MGDLISRKEHKIKIKKRYYDAVLKGEKTFEIRKNDRDYNVGDIINFIPIADDCDMILPHNQTSYKVTYVFHGGEYGLEEGYCVFGIAPIEVNPQWIPCSERLPDGCESAELEVLVFMKEKYIEAEFQEVGFALYYPDRKRFHSVYGDLVDITEIVVAWMPLPEPYQQT